MKTIELIQSFKDKNILVLGDLIIDEYIDGYCSRYAAEANVPIMDVKARKQRLGGAGNVAANVASLGAKVTLCTLIGEDIPCSFVEDLLEESKIYDHKIVIEKERNTLIKTRLSVEKNILYRIDNGNTGKIKKSSEKKLIDFLRKNSCHFDGILISDYNKGLMTSSLIEELKNIKQDHSIFMAMDGRGYEKYAHLELSLITPNFKEAAALVQREEKTFHDRLKEASSWGKDLYNTTKSALCALTLDKDGVMLFEKDQFHFHCTSQEIKRPNVCGAGDTFFAAHALALLSGFSNYQALELANKAAQIRIQKEGMTCTAQELILDKIHDENQKEINSPLQLKIILDQMRQNKTVVFTNGCFDIFHSGHVNYLKKAKELGDILIVAINNDKSVSRLKGSSRPVNKLKDRIAILEALSCIDFIIPFGEKDEDHPEKLIALLEPDVFVKGNDYANKEMQEKKTLEKIGCSIFFMPLTPHQSTTKIINRVQGLSPLTLQKSS